MQHGAHILPAYMRYAYAAYHMGGSVCARKEVFLRGKRESVGVPNVMPFPHAKCTPWPSALHVDEYTPPHILILDTVFYRLHGSRAGILKDARPSHPPLELLERRSTLRRATRRHATQLRTQNTAGTRSRRPRGAPGVRKWRSRSAGHERRVRAQIMDAPDATKRQRIIDDEVSQRHKDEDEANTRATNTNAWSQRRSD